MGTRESKKQAVLIDILQWCKAQHCLDFDNALVKAIAQRHGFGNPFDVTKLDSTAVFPELLLREDLFILHTGQGKHRFVRGIHYGFHPFEPITEEETQDWKYRQSILNEFDTSESNILSVASNQRILHEFLYSDITASPKVYNARRTKMSLAYLVGSKSICTSNSRWKSI